MPFIFHTQSITVCLHAGVKILVDPWLVDELTFAGQRWLYRGKKTHISPVDPDEVAKGCDAVILSQVKRCLDCSEDRTFVCVTCGMR